MPVKVFDTDEEAIASSVRKQKLARFIVTVFVLFFSVVCAYLSYKYLLAPLLSPKPTSTALQISNAQPPAHHTRVQPQTRIYEFTTLQRNCPMALVGFDTQSGPDVRG